MTIDFPTQIGFLLQERLSAELKKTVNYAGRIVESEQSAQPLRRPLQWSEKPTVITVKPHRTELLGLRASVGGVAVFLDLFAIKELAKGDSSREETLRVCV